MRLVLAALAAVALTVVAACTSSASAPSHTAGAPSGTSSPSAVPSISPSTTATRPSPSSTAVSPSTGPSTTPSTTGAATQSTVSTRQIVVHPVTAAGVPSAGWSVRTNSSTVDCSGGLRSPVSESADVLYCSPSAASAIACWRAADHAHAYCLLDPRGRTLTRYALANGSFPAAGRSELQPAPMGLDLVGGGTCDVRDGGAASRLATHPDWVAYYFCGAADDTAVWASPDSTDSGVTHGDGAWTVQVARSDGSAALVTREIAVAYFVGTA